MLFLQGIVTFSCIQQSDVLPSDIERLIWYATHSLSGYFEEILYKERLVFSNKSPRHVAWLWEISLNPDYTEGTGSNYYTKCLNIIIMYYQYHIKEKRMVHGM